MQSGRPVERKEPASHSDWQHQRLDAPELLRPSRRRMTVNFTAKIGVSEVVPHAKCKGLRVRAGTHG